MSFEPDDATLDHYAKPDAEKVQSAEEFAAELQREAQGCGYDWRQGHFEGVLLAAIQSRDAAIAAEARREALEDAAFGMDSKADEIKQAAETYSKHEPGDPRENLLREAGFYRNVAAALRRSAVALVDGGGQER